MCRDLPLGLMAGLAFDGIDKVKEPYTVYVYIYVMITAPHSGTIVSKAVNHLSSFIRRPFPRLVTF